MNHPITVINRNLQGDEIRHCHGDFVRMDGPALHNETLFNGEDSPFMGASVNNNIGP